MIFVLNYIDRDGSPGKRSVTAGNKDEAIESSGIPSRKILSVRQDYIAKIKDDLLYPPPSDDQQAVFLSGLSAQLSSGQDIRTAMKYLLSSTAGLRVNYANFAKALTVSQYLEALKFSPVAITLAKVGEKSDNIGASLQTAAENIVNEKTIKAEMGKGTTLGIVYLLAGIVFMIIPPIAFGPMIESAQNTSGLVMNSGITTDVIIALREFYISSYPVVTLLIVLSVIFRKRIWGAIKDMGPFKFIRDLGLLIRGLKFLMSFKPLYTSGVTIEHSLELLRDNSSGIEREIYDSMLENVRTGDDLSDVIDTDNWPGTLRTGLKGFGNINESVKPAVIDTLINTLRLQQNVLSGQIGSVTKYIGMGIAVSAILLIVFGVVLPMQSMSAA